MARVIYYAAATLDGFIADPDDGIRWLTEYEGSYEGKDAEPMKGSYDHFYDGIGALVMGSTTYEWVLEHVSGWPYSGKPAWVLSSRNLPLPEGEDAGGVRVVNSKVTDIHGDVAAGARRRAIGVLGGGNIAAHYAAAGLLHEVIITLVPNKERPSPTAPPMELKSTHAWDTGMVELRYEVHR